MKLAAVIFDLDGTVVADEGEYGEAFRRVLKKFGVYEKSRFPHISGIGVAENWPIFIKKYRIKTDKSIEELALETQQEYKKLIQKVTLRRGFINFVESLRASGVKVLLATSNNWDIVELLFDRLAIEKYFDGVTTGEEVSFKKPEPDLFLTSSDKMGIRPQECLVIEDSEVGVKAAKRAGMKVIGLARDEKHKKTLEDADLVSGSFEEISPESIQNL